MGKRGPKPGGKTVVLSTRIKPKTRDALLKAAKQNGQSISAEVEYRLRRSFEEDEKLEDRLGGLQLYAIFKQIASSLTLAAQTALSAESKARRGASLLTGRGYTWLTNAYAFDQAVQAAFSTIQRFRPYGDPAPPSENDRFVGYEAADEWARLVAEADPTMPLLSGKRPTKQQVASLIAAHLGPLRHRLEGRKK